MAGYCSEEDRNLYRPGGFHPVHLGDIFHYRYEVLRKLGYGGYSTVWLVKDQRWDDYVIVLLITFSDYLNSSELAATRR